MSYFLHIAIRVDFVTCFSPLDLQFLKVYEHDRFLKVYEHDSGMEGVCINVKWSCCEIFYYEPRLYWKSRTGKCRASFALAGLPVRLFWPQISQLWLFLEAVRVKKIGWPFFFLLIFGFFGGSWHSITHTIRLVFCLFEYLNLAEEY